MVIAIIAIIAILAAMLLPALDKAKSKDQAVRGQPIAWVIFGIDNRLSIVLYVGMPRKLRIEYPGAMYHVMSRGDRREKIYLDDVDRQDFVKTLAEACQKTNWQVHAYCLMPNHYHLVLETPEPNLVAGMAWLQSTYTIRLNHRHQLFGHVLSGRYKAQLVEGSGNGYLRTACDYVHLNPVRARMLQAPERLLSYPWSSFGAYMAAPEHRPSLGAGGPAAGRARNPGGHADEPGAVRAVDGAAAAGGDGPEALKVLRRGWCLGSGVPAGDVGEDGGQAWGASLR